MGLAESGPTCATLFRARCGEAGGRRAGSSSSVPSRVGCTYGGAPPGQLAYEYFLGLEGHTRVLYYVL